MGLEGSYIIPGKEGNKIEVNQVIPKPSKEKIEVNQVIPKPSKEKFKYQIEQEEALKSQPLESSTGRALNSHHAPSLPDLASNSI
jgi:hypothetical protein